MNMIEIYKNKSRPPMYILWFGWFIGGICDMVDGLINTVTLCLYNPWLGFKWRFYWARVELRNYKLHR